MRYRVLPYRQGSKSAKALSEALGGKVLKLQNSKFNPHPEDVVINWGATAPGPMEGLTLLEQWKNFYGRVRRASNKLLFLQLMREEGLDDIIPAFWTSPDDIPDEAFPVVCRTQLAGHSGAGIVISNNRSSLVPAPLYTQYIKKQAEYRIHVGMRDGVPVVIAQQRKARKLDVPDHAVNWQVRNLAGGFVYVRQDVNAGPTVTDAAKVAIAASGLDFGAVDVIWNESQERAYVLEINTAPGLEGQTIGDYARFFKGD